MGRYRHGQIVIEVGDLATVRVDALLVPHHRRWAGTELGKLAEAAGPEVEEAIKKLGPLEPGDVRATSGFGLKAKTLIHAAEPPWKGGSDGEDSALARLYDESLRQALEHDAVTVGIPSFLGRSTSRFPKRRVAEILLSSVIEFLDQHPMLEQIVLVMGGEDELAIHEMVAEDYL